MIFDLPSMARANGIRRDIAFAPILMSSALASQLARINVRLIDPWTKAWDRIGPLYEQELKSRLMRDNVEQMRSLFESIGQEVSRLVLDLTPELQKWAFDVESWHRGKWARAVLAGTDVAISAMIGPANAAETIEDFLQRNTSLIRNISDEARGQIADIVFRSLQRRRSPREAAKLVAERVDISVRRAKRVAADQAVKLASALDAQRQREAGLTHWKWRHSGKLHFRPEHKARDGNIYTDETAPDDLPGELPYCGCVRQGIIIFDD